MSQSTSTSRLRIEPTWWAPIALVCLVGLVVGAFLPIMLGQVGGSIEFPISMVGLVAAVLGLIRDRRLGWRVVAALVGLGHLAVVVLYGYLSRLMTAVLGS